MRFLAPRVSGAFQLRALETPPRGSFVADFFRPTYRIRAGCYRDLTGTVKVPATSMGFTYCPSQFCFRPRVMTSRRRLAPTCRFATYRREFHRHGVHRV
jgi:hypothetical protein